MTGSVGALAPGIAGSKTPVPAIGRGSERSLRPCTRGAIMREASEVMVRPLPTYSRAAARRRRLHRGVELWNLDRKNCAEPTRRIAFVTLTFADRDITRAQGCARDFWGAVRHKWLGTRYFCWLELNRDGQVHYHAIWVNPPNRQKVNLLSWVDAHWGQGRTQVRFKQPSRGDDGLVDYVLKYAKKMGNKSWQQDYQGAPRTLRTFMSQRLEVPPAELLEHLEHDLWRYDAATEGLISEWRWIHVLPDATSSCSLSPEWRAKGPRRARAPTPDARARARLLLQRQRNRKRRYVS